MAKIVDDDEVPSETTILLLDGLPEETCPSEGAGRRANDEGDGLDVVPRQRGEPELGRTGTVGAGRIRRERGSIDDDDDWVENGEEVGGYPSLPFVPSPGVRIESKDETRDPEG